jgi:hypothetical protein
MYMLHGFLTAEEHNPFWENSVLMEFSMKTGSAMG